MQLNFKNELASQEAFRIFRVQNKQVMNYPDAKKHQIISFIKSIIRILGYGFIPFNLVTATIILILSEIIGIVEELV